ncbi:hypothetical protein BH23ACT11_BH23ACT11_25100 [soil metagenome]
MCVLYHALIYRSVGWFLENQEGPHLSEVRGSSSDRDANDNDGKSADPMWRRLLDLRLILAAEAAGAYALLRQYARHGLLSMPVCLPLGVLS